MVLTWINIWHMWFRILSWQLLEFGFYVPQIAMLFALLGLYHIIRNKGIHPWLIFLSIAIASILIYIYRPSITPDHPWASRRWITVNIPAVLLMAVYGIQKTRIEGKRLNRWVKIAVTGMIFVFLLSQSGLFLFQSMLKGYGRQFEEVAGAMAGTIPEEDLVFTDNVQLASPLTYINGEKVYILKEEGLSEPMANFIREEGPVYGIGWPNSTQVNLLFQRGISADLISSHKLTGLYPEESRGHYPEKLIRRDYDAAIRRLDDSSGNLYYTYSLTSDFLTQNGSPEGESMASNGQAGFVLYGNYTPLAAGTYELSFSGTLPGGLPDTDADGNDTGANDTNEGAAGNVESDAAAGEDSAVQDGGAANAFIDIAYNRGAQVLTVRDLTEFTQVKKLDGTVSFTLEQGASDLEFRIFAGQNIPLKVDKMVLRKVE